MSTPTTTGASVPAEGAARATAVILLILSLAAALLAFTVDAAVLAQNGRPAVAAGWSGAIPGLAMAIPGALLLLRISWHPIAIAFLVYGAWWAVDGLASAWVNAALTLFPGAPGAAIAFWIYERLGAGLLTAIPVILALFPDGRLPAGRWRVVAVGSIVCTSLMPLTSLVAPTSELTDQAAQEMDPRLSAIARTAWALPLPDGVWPVVLVVARLALVVGLLAAVAVILHARRGADEVRRAQLRWLVWAAVVAVLTLLSWFVLPVEVSTVLQTLGLAAIPIAVVIAVTRYRLYDIDALLGWTVISALLLSSFVVADLALAGMLGASLGSGPVTVLAAVVVAALYLPFRSRLGRLVTRLISGEREDPYAVMASLSERLEHAQSSQQQLDMVAQAIHRAFKSPFVRLDLERADGSTLTAQLGVADDSLAPRTITYRGHVIGTLTMAPARRPKLSARDGRLLDDLVRQAAAAIGASDANDQLRAIRAALVTAREDERRRMRGELHDGVGPVLAGVVLRLDAVAGRVADNAPVHDLIIAAADDASRAVDEVRRISQGLGPAALAELGLRRAIVEQCERLSAGGGCRITHDIDIEHGLPAATEVAIYRIVSEALTNIVRHSGARSARVRVEQRDDMIELEVEDDGAGLGPAPGSGAGLASQRQRALELGGRWSIGPAESGGTIVRAVIPVIASVTSAASASSPASSSSPERLRA